VTNPSPQGPSLGSGLFCPGPSTLNRPDPSPSRAHRDFTARRLIRDAFAVRERLGAIEATKCDARAKRDCGNDGSAEPVGPRRRPCRHWVSGPILVLNSPGSERTAMSGRFGPFFSANFMEGQSGTTQFKRPQQAGFMNQRNTQPSSRITTTCDPQGS
jgi:hypothetical protein